MCRPQEQQWHADVYHEGASRKFRVRPRSYAKRELERSFREAVAWHKKAMPKKVMKVMKAAAKSIRKGPKRRSLSGRPSSIPCGSSPASVDGGPPRR